MGTGILREGLEVKIPYRMDFFAQMGCNVPGHSLEYVMYALAAEEKVNEIFKKRLDGENISREDSLYV